jgi:hypothetical protein
MGRRWTDRDIEELRRLARQKTTQIAESLDRSVGSVVFKAYTLTLPLRPNRSSHVALEPGPAGFEWHE